MARFCESKSYWENCMYLCTALLSAPSSENNITVCGIRARGYHIDAHGVPSKWWMLLHMAFHPKDECCLNYESFFFF